MTGEVVQHNSSGPDGRVVSVLFKGPSQLVGRMNLRRLEKNAKEHRIRIELGSERNPVWRGAVSSVFPNSEML